MRQRDRREQRDRAGGERAPEKQHQNTYTLVGKESSSTDEGVMVRVTKNRAPHQTGERDRDKRAEAQAA